MVDQPFPPDPELSPEEMDAIIALDRDPGPFDPVAHEEAWRVEIERRVAELERGEVKSIPWEEVRRGLMEHLERSPDA